MIFDMQVKGDYIGLIIYLLIYDSRIKPTFGLSLPPVVCSSLLVGMSFFFFYVICVCNLS